MAGKTEATFEFDPGTLAVNLAGFSKKVDAAVGKLFDYYAATGEAAMKRGARWTDRTGNARNGLSAKAEHERDHHSIVLAHGVKYGVFLETRWAGRYAIVGPTSQSLGRQVMSGLNNLFAKLPGGA